MKYALMLAVAATAFGATTFATTPAHAIEDWRSNLYIRGGIGWNHAQDQDFAAGSEASLKDGYAATGAVGLDFAGARIEAELSYRHDEVDELTAAGAPLPTPEGTLVGSAFMINGYLDMPTDTLFTPYIGVGVGVAKVKVNEYTSAGTILIDDTENVMAGQVMLGTNYTVMPNFDLYGEYRYFMTQDVDVSGTDASYRNHAIMVGAKYMFQ